MGADVLTTPSRHLHELIRWQMVLAPKRHAHILAFPWLWGLLIDIIHSQAPCINPAITTQRLTLIHNNTSYLQRCVCMCVCVFDITWDRDYTEMSGWAWGNDDPRVQRRVNTAQAVWSTCACQSCVWATVCTWMWPAWTSSSQEWNKGKNKKQQKQAAAQT